MTFNGGITPDLAPHLHPEYRPFGYIGNVQNVPGWAINGAVDYELLPNMFALKVTVPPFTRFESLSLAINGTGGTGSMQAAVYDASTMLPIAASLKQANFYKWSGFQYVSLNGYGDPSAVARDVWAVFTCDAQGGKLPMVMPHLPGIDFIGSKCFSTSELTELPVRLDFAGWQQEGRIPLIAMK
ncbi:hypothetical protein [Streptosporangium canum]|uniref:hypothetical protein n=1 Tax=Streptosporangium canum TaxID=324952 RepID=UPI00379B3459